MVDWLNIGKLIPYMVNILEVVNRPIVSASAWALLLYGSFAGDRGIAANG